ncbi:hypothetical protein DRQ07_06355 [candidate division KSB1 bacterium]|nr:MAG: hypothetical protein DRQ07_06355 [candidate division KSB1 bacterium]
MSIDTILIASPDKISLSGFIRFIIKRVPEKYEIGELHSLMSSESIELFFKDFTETYSKRIFSYYAKRAVNIEPLSIIPECLKESDIIIWFKLYSMIPIVLKDTSDFMDNIIQDWNNYIKILER